MSTRSPPAVHLQEKDVSAIEDLSHDGDDERVSADPKPASASTNGYEAHEEIKEHSSDVDSLYEELLDDVEPFRYSEGTSRAAIHVSPVFTSHRSRHMHAERGPDVQGKTS